MTNEDDLNDGLDDLSYSEDSYPDDRDDRDRPFPYPYHYSPYGWYPRPRFDEPEEPDISNGLLNALLKSHAREVELLREIIAMKEEAFKNDN